MVTAHLQPVAMGKVDVTLKHLVNTVTALCRLQVDVGHLGIIPHGLPEHVALVMAHVDAMHMGASVLTLDIIALCMRRQDGS